MKKLLNNISRKLSLTETEIKTIIFVLVIFGVGVLIKYNEFSVSVKQKVNFKYDFHDSLFIALSKKGNKLDNVYKKDEKKVDSESELLDFSNKKKYQKKKSNTEVKNSSININTANLRILTSLPGIGPKTASKIIALRTKKNGFNSLDELTEVSGIGIKKLSKIKRFLIKIEK